MSRFTAGAGPYRMPAPSFGEFVAIVAVMMGLVSLSIDNLLPAFGPIQRDLAVADANDLQLLVSVFLIGFAIMKIVYGPVADAIGRRPTAMIGFTLFAVGSLLAVTADSFTILLLARAVQGMGAAAMRVLAITIVRDRYEGREMARVMSLTMMIFIIVPVIAPATGSLTLMVGSWHLIFATTLVLALMIAVWFGLRMPETLRPEYRHPLSARRIASGFYQTATTRESLGYATGMGLMFGCLIAYIASSPQIFETEVYNLGPLFPVAFGVIAAMMGVASLVNAQLVRRLGMRRLSHAGIVGFVLFATVQLGIALLYDGKPPLILFGIVLGCCQFLFCLTVPNFNAMAMAPLGAIAGTASSLIGFYTTLMGALLGLAIGRAFDETVVPLGVGYLGLGLLCLIVVLWTERGRLFVPRHPDPVATAGKVGAEARQ